MGHIESKEAKAAVEKLKELGLEPIHPSDERTETESKNALRIELEGGVEDVDLAKLLDDTAAFIRGMEKGKTTAGPLETREFMFKRLNMSDYVIMAHRS